MMNLFMATNILSSQWLATNNAITVTEELGAADTRSSKCLA